MIYETYSVGGVLYHHGILGQKHGVRNGPPYPLDENDHNAREKKDGWEKSLGKRGESHHDSIYERYRNKKAKKRFERNYKKLRKTDDTSKDYDKRTKKVTDKYTKMVKKSKVSNEELLKYKTAKEKYDKLFDKLSEKYEYEDVMNNKQLTKAREDLRRERANIAKKVIGDFKDIDAKKINKENISEFRKSDFAKNLNISDQYLKKRLKY